MPRKTSQSDVPFPFRADTTAFILVPTGSMAMAVTSGGRGYEHASTHDKKYELIRKAQQLSDEGIPATLLAVWPGASRSDVFEVDDLSQALQAMGSTPPSA